MKRKFIIFLTALITAACAILSGCSCAGCSGDETLAFSNAFHGGSQPPANYNETLTYSVSYSADYLSGFKKDAELSKYFTFEYGENNVAGTYRSELKSATEAELSEINSDIKNVGKIYKLTTNFSVQLKFLTLNGATCDYVKDEIIQTEAYIAAADMSFAPIYTKETSIYCIVSVSDDKAEITVADSVNETLYNKDEYVKTLKYREYGIDEQNIESVEYKTNVNTVDYDFRSAIDNAELFFALRGVSLAVEDDTVIPVVAAAYNDPTPLKITNVKRASDNMTINYVKDDEPKAITEKITYNTLEYRINKTNAAGWAQSINIQAKSAGDLPNLALPLKFAKPLFAYRSGSNIIKMGSLVFTLTDVIVNN